VSDATTRNLERRALSGRLEDLERYELTVARTRGDIMNAGRWAVRIVRAGDRYGRDYCLTHPTPPLSRYLGPDPTPLVEWHDTKYVGKFGGLGQFVSRYTLPTMLAHGPHGLCLHGGVAEWRVSPGDFARVRAWLGSEKGDA